MRPDAELIRLVTVTLAGLFVLAGCSGSGRAGNGEIIVFAAASLTESFTELKAGFEEEHPDLQVTYNFAGSQQLATQITQGADADVFASADTAQMEIVQDAGLAAREPVTFAHNRLVVIVPDENPADISDPADLANPGTKLVLANQDVPAGHYARSAVERMSADPAFGDGFRERVQANIVSNESNVKQVVTKVQLGEADAGIVYRTDITADVAGDVQFFDIPAPLNVTADYSITTVADGNREIGQEFIDYVRSDSGQRILAAYGFDPGSP